MIEYIFKDDSNFKTQTRKSRQEVADILSKYESANQTTQQSQRQIADQIGIPRSTLQYWIERKDSINAEPAVKDFFESPTGTAFLHRLVLAAHFIMTLSGPGSVRQVCQFLELTGLDQFIASSYGSQQKASVNIEESIVDFDKDEKRRMAKGMKPKEITVCQDETFHPETCLVQHEIIKGTSAPLSSKTKKAQIALEKSAEEVKTF